jgi:hypothetical protein
MKRLVFFPDLRKEKNIKRLNHLLLAKKVKKGQISPIWPFNQRSKGENVTRGGGRSEKGQKVSHIF